MRGSDDDLARKVVTSILSAPSTDEIKLINGVNALRGVHATITEVTFPVDQGSLCSLKSTGEAANPQKGVITR